MNDYSKIHIDAADGKEVVIEAFEHPDAPTPTERAKPRMRRLGLLGVSSLIAIGAVASFALWLLAPPSEETDDAYVGGDVVTITAREAGTVMALHADNTQAVHSGDRLIELDPATQDVALASAEAELGKVVRDFRAQVSSVDVASAGVAQAQAELGRADADLVRRKGAVDLGVVSGEEVDHAMDAVSAARAALNSATARRVQAQSAISGTSVFDNPSVLAAAAAVRRAAISRAYMNIAAPEGGIVAQRTVQLGQHVAAGTPLMAVVPLNAVWIDANFRETQLENLRVGQPVIVRADVYGRGTTFHGRVLGLGAGSGNAFSLLPPQNASGNWIKIVQRVPVRIALDPAELARAPLRVGLSVDVTIATSDRSGPFVGGSRAPAGGVQASVDGGPRVEQRIRQIILKNMGAA